MAPAKWGGKPRISDCGAREERMALEPQAMTEMYRRMVTIRTFDRRAVDEFHAGNIPGVVHAYIGEEAVAVGAPF